MSDDDRWLEALRRGPGAAAPLDDADAATARLRAVILRADRGTPDGEIDAAEKQRLLFRLQREGLLDRAARRPPYLVWSAAAVLALALGLGMMLPLQAPAPDTVLRGDGRSVLRDAQPAARAQQLSEILRRHAAEVVLTDLEDGGVELRATVPPGTRPAATQALAAQGLRLPADGRLQLDILPP